MKTKLRTFARKQILREPMKKLVKSKKDYRQLVGTLFRKQSISYHLWFSHSKF